MEINKVPFWNHISNLTKINNKKRCKSKTLKLFNRFTRAFLPFMTFAKFLMMIDSNFKMENINPFMLEINCLENKSNLHI